MTIFKNLSFISTLLFACTTTHAQYCLKTEFNTMISGDVINRELVAYTSAGENGENILWDFSCVDFLDECIQLFYTGNDTILSVIGKGDINHLCLRNDSVWQTASQTPLQIVSYTEMPLVAVFPFSYGDSIKTQFRGHGKYCDTQYISTFGTTHIQADGYGDMILPQNDTIKNVLRLHSICYSSIGMDADSSALDSVCLKQIIEERYSWYARGYRYPVYEIISTSCYDDAIQVSCIQKAYKYLPNIETLYRDSINHKVIVNDSIIEMDKGQPKNEIIRYDISTNNKLITINYELDTPAHILVIVANITGILNLRKDIQSPAGEYNTINLNCNDFPNGQYILYLNVNGRIYSDKINL